MPPRAPGALGRTSLVGEGFSTVGVRPGVAGPGCGWATAGEACAGAGAGAAAVGVGSRRLAGASAVVSGFGSCFLAAAPSPAPVPGAPCNLKYSAHVSSTELGSVVYRSYISSSNQSLAPKSASGALVDDSSGTMATGCLLPDTSCARVLPAFGLHPACSRHAPGRRYLGYPTLRPDIHWLLATHLVSVNFVDPQSRRVTAVLSMTSAPSMRHAIRQTSMVKTTRARLRMAVTTVEMTIIACPSRPR
jgi:hypothetical protein